jgi:hypothetical protein
MMEFPYYQNKLVHFKDVSKRLIKRFFKEEKHQISGNLRKRLKKSWKGKFAVLKKSGKVDGVNAA